MSIPNLYHSKFRKNRIFFVPALRTDVRWAGIKKARRIETRRARNAIVWNEEVYMERRNFTTASLSLLLRL